MKGLWSGSEAGAIIYKFFRHLTIPEYFRDEACLCDDCQRLRYTELLVLAEPAARSGPKPRRSTRECLLVPELVGNLDLPKKPSIQAVPTLGPIKPANVAYIELLGSLGCLDVTQKVVHEPHHTALRPPRKATRSLAKVQGIMKKKMEATIMGYMGPI